MMGFYFLVHEGTCLGILGIRLEDYELGLVSRHGLLVFFSGNSRGRRGLWLLISPKIWDLFVTMYGI